MTTAWLLAACSGGSSASEPATSPAKTPSRTRAEGSTTTDAPASTTTSPSTAACSRPRASGQSTQSFSFGGATRTYELYVPRSYDGTRRVPVVFEFHGFGSNAKQQIVYGDFRPLAERNDFLIVAPDGQGTPRHFNLVPLSGPQSDVSMAEALLDRIEATFCVDPARVYSTGMSNGAGLTVVLACVAADRFAAFGPVAASGYRDGCGGSRPVAMVGFAGTADPVVPFYGGKVNCCGGATVKAAPANFAGWAAHDHCNATYADDRLGTQVVRRTWPGCENGGAVVFYIIEGGGHTWPGSAFHRARLGVTTTQIDASDTIWRFFAQHALTRS
jgi:polyhydroxybutyrate depolymerase